MARSRKIPRDAKAALVTIGQTHGTYKVTTHLEVPINVCRAVTFQLEIEREIIARNRRYLQQTEQEKGITKDPLMQEIHANYRINPSSQVIPAGTYETSYAISEEQAAWFRRVKQTGQEKTCQRYWGLWLRNNFKQPLN